MFHVKHLTSHFGRKKEQTDPAGKYRIGLFFFRK